VQELKSENYTVRVISPGILEAFIHDRASLEPKDFWEMKQMNLNLSDGLPYLIIIQTGYFVRMSDEFKALTLKKDTDNKALARALLVNSLGHRIAGNFYVNFNKLQIKTRLFSERENAIKWLEKQKNKGDTQSVEK
jgi:hypothetical protein